MKKLLVLFPTILLIGAACNQTTQVDDTTLTIYAYDSLTADYGLLPAITDQFEAEQGVEVELVSFADTGAMLNQLIVERAEPKADVVIGLDNINFTDVVTYNLFTPYRPQRADDLDPTVVFDDQFTMTPFDYGYIGWVYDSEQITFPEPVSLQELANDPAYSDKIIIEQAGLSSPGTQLMVWAQAALDDDDANEFAGALSKQVLTVAPDWNTAYYSMFLNGEAPIVLSYLTSPAYHIDQEATDRYQAIPITDGYVRQVEGVGIVAGTANATAAQAWVDYLLTNEVQNTIPTTQWMWPVLGDASTWPAAYQDIITPADEDILPTSYDPSWLADWNQAFGIQ